MKEKKKCYRCYEVKELNQFPVRKEQHIGVCSSCYSIHYGDPDKIEEQRLNNMRLANKRRANKCRAFIKNILTKSKCTDCGYSNWIALEFDHREPEKKYKDISIIASCGSITVLKEEIKKCDVVCANCHTIRTHNMFGSWRVTMKD